MRTIEPRAWLVIGFLMMTACASPWNKHQQKLAEYQQDGDWDGAMEETQWLINNALMFAPPEERSPALDADRYLLLADCATRAGRTKEALDALREALMRDPSSAPSIRRKLERLPLSPAERKRIEAEYAWNMAALAPGDPGWVESQREMGRCWSYRVKEVRVRRSWTQRTEHGKEQRVSYDARPWLYYAEQDRWVVDGEWMTDAGAEMQVVGAAEQPRYRAILAADGGFLTERWHLVRNPSAAGFRRHNSLELFC
jgi:tetratricopeptide (TPR) repeat protein